MILEFKGDGKKIVTNLIFQYPQKTFSKVCFEKTCHS